MYRKLSFGIALLLQSFLAFTQQNGTISGHITDSKSNNLSNVSVNILNSDYGTLTDKDGKFQFTKLNRGKYVLSISAVGYAAINKEVNTSDATIDITLNESDVQLDEVIVSAQKKEELLQKVPFSISAISSRKVQEYRLWYNKDLTAIIPNMNSTNPGDGRNVTSIRGIATTSYDPAIATYIDGVSQFNLDTYIPQLFDVERIEVLRGPQGTLYGRNAMGGVINIITKRPTNQPNGFAEISVGNYGQQRYNAGVRTPIIKNKLFIGAAAMYNKLGGFYDNEYNNSKFDKQHSITGNYYLKYLVSPEWAITLNVKHVANRNNGPFSLVNGVDEAFANPYKLNQNATTEMVDNTFNSSLVVNYSGAALNFTSQTAWQTNYRYYKTPIDGDFSPIDGVTIINNYGKNWNNVKALTQEFRFTSPASVTSKLKWTSGIYLFSQLVPNKQATHFGEDAGMLGSPDKNFGIITTSDGKSFGTAVYGQASYDVNDKLEITAGVRYDYEHKKQSVLGQYQVDPDPNPVFDTRPDTSATVNFNAFSPKLSVAYHFTSHNTGYVTYSRGYRAGGFTQLSSDPSQPPLFTFKPEYSNSYEAGIKNNFMNDRIRLNIAVFYTTINNAQVPTLVLPDAVTITKNAGKLHSKGAEAEFAATPVRNLEIINKVVYTDAKYKTLKVPKNGAEVDLEGNKQVYTPVATSALAAQYGYDLGTKQNLKAVVRAEWLYVGKQYFDLANNISQDGYSLFNTRFGIAAKNFEIMFWGRNLGGKKYIAYAYDFGAIHLGDPKTYGITLTGKF